MKAHVDEIVTTEDRVIKIARPYAYLGEGIYFETSEELQILIALGRTG